MLATHRAACYQASAVRTLGVDPGDARVGLAVSDDDGTFASPLRTIAARGEGDPAKRIAEEAARAGCGEIVVGLPRNLDGSEGGAARKARALAGRVRAVTGLRVVLWDERLTTAEASRALSAVDMRARDQRSVVDQVAATILLQSYLDARAARRRARRAAKQAAQGAVAQPPSTDTTEAVWSATSEDAASEPVAPGEPGAHRA
jgi:putative Holliday junction resolvase